MSPFRSLSPFTFAALLAAAGSTSAFADCHAKTAAFDAAVSARAPADILHAYNDIKDDTGCDFDIDQFRPRAIGAMIDALNDPSKAAEAGMAEQFAIANIPIAVDWRLAEKLGDHYAAARKSPKALEWYEAALDLAHATPADKFGSTEWKRLEQKAAAAKIAASNDDEGRSSGQFAPSRAAADGTVGGVLAPPPNRAVEAEAVALPINFYFDSARFTPAGEKAVQELLAAIQQQGVPALRLIGHADPRGDRRYNIALSLKRAEAVRAFLLQELSRHGAAVEIQVQGVGAEQPFDVSVLAYQPSPDELYELERRVDFVRLGQ